MPNPLYFQAQNPFHNGKRNLGVRLPAEKFRKERLFPAHYPLSFRQAKIPFYQPSRQNISPQMNQREINWFLSRIKPIQPQRLQHPIADNNPQKRELFVQRYDQTKTYYPFPTADRDLENYEFDTFDDKPNIKPESPRLRVQTPAIMKQKPILPLWLPANFDKPLQEVKPKFEDRLKRLKIGTASVIDYVSKHYQVKLIEDAPSYGNKELIESALKEKELLGINAMHDKFPQLFETKNKVVNDQVGIEFHLKKDVLTKTFSRLNTLLQKYPNLMKKSEGLTSYLTQRTNQPDLLKTIERLNTAITFIIKAPEKDQENYLAMIVMKYDQCLSGYCRDLTDIINAIKDHPIRNTFNAFVQEQVPQIERDVIVNNQKHVPAFIDLMLGIPESVVKNEESNVYTPLTMISGIKIHDTLQKFQQIALPEKWVNSFSKLAKTIKTFVENPIDVSVLKQFKWLEELNIKLIGTPEEYSQGTALINGDILDPFSELSEGSQNKLKNTKEIENQIIKVLKKVGLIKQPMKENLFLIDYKQGSMNPEHVTELLVPGKKVSTEEVINAINILFVMQSNMRYKTPTAFFDAMFHIEKKYGLQVISNLGDSPKIPAYIKEKLNYIISKYFHMRDLYSRPDASKMDPLTMYVKNRFNPQYYKTIDLNLLLESGSPDQIESILKQKAMPLTSILNHHLLKNPNSLTVLRNLFQKKIIKVAPNPSSTLEDKQLFFQQRNQSFQGLITAAIYENNTELLNFLDHYGIQPNVNEAISTGNEYILTYLTEKLNIKLNNDQLCILKAINFRLYLKIFLNQTKAGYPINQIPQQTTRRNFRFLKNNELFITLNNRVNVHLKLTQPFNSKSELTKFIQHHFNCTDFTYYSGKRVR